MEMISINSSKSASSVKIDNNININPYNDIQVKTESEAKTSKVDNTIEAYKKIIEVLVNKRYVFRQGKYILHADDLITIIKLLINCDISIKCAEDIGCINKMFRIESIISEQDTLINVKYNRPDIYEILSNCKISTKYIIY